LGLVGGSVLGGSVLGGSVVGLLLAAGAWLHSPRTSVNGPALVSRSTAGTHMLFTVTPAGGPPGT
jgi:hypothetical protein